LGVAETSATHQLHIASTKNWSSVFLGVAAPILQFGMGETPPQSKKGEIPQPPVPKVWNYSFGE